MKTQTKIPAGERTQIDGKHEDYRFTEGPAPMGAKWFGFDAPGHFAAKLACIAYSGTVVNPVRGIDICGNYWCTGEVPTPVMPSVLPEDDGRLVWPEDEGHPANQRESNDEVIARQEKVLARLAKPQLPQHYALSHEPTPQKLWNEEDMRDYAKVYAAELVDGLRLALYKIDDVHDEGCAAIAALVPCDCTISKIERLLQ